jgi:hypothetical protein
MTQNPTTTGRLSSDKGNFLQALRQLEDTRAAGAAPIHCGTLSAWWWAA